MGKVKQAIQEVEEEVVSLVGDIPRSLVYVQKRLPELLKIIHMLTTKSWLRIVLTRQYGREIMMRSIMSKEYLVLVSDVVAKQIRIKANSEEDALTKAGSGDWFNNQVEKEDVVDRQAEEILDE